jgi:hypothetical protein
MDGTISVKFRGMLEASALGALGVGALLCLAVSLLAGRGLKWW